MDDALLDLILDRLDKEPLDDQVADLLLAACESADALGRSLGGGRATRPTASGRSATAHEPEGAYLTEISVAGFRGIGPECTLPLDPGPGLTLVVGRNGSGKSSFAEGLEVLLTGRLRRWHGRPVVWQESWRNLHSPQGSSIRAGLTAEGGRAVDLARHWEDGAPFDKSTATMQVRGEKRRQLSDLGWDEALEAFRPLLSHSELEAFFGSPTELYELLASVLGLDDLVVTAERLATARKQLEASLTGAKRSLPALLDRLVGLDDERARAVHRALSAKKWDLDTAEAVATGTDASSPSAELDQLRRLAALPPIDREVVAAAAAELRAAAAEVEGCATSESGRALDLAELLEAGIAHRAHSGSRDCPLCGSLALLDEEWAERATAQVHDLRAQAEAAMVAQRRAAQARRAAQGLIAPLPGFLAEAMPQGIEPGRLLKAWQAWSDPPRAEDPAGWRALADHLDQKAPEMHGAATELASAAAVALRALEDRWAPVAAEVVSWVGAARAAQAAEADVKRLKTAENWLKEANDDIRNSRLAPIAEQARSIWTQLRQESNVDLGVIRLSGTGNKRKLEIDVSVDGTDSAALGVMSQGEVNALALSIFLPRATLPASPFRFLAIDDPVQAMDPAKVDGFARVLADFATRRQVVVFTHDDRLPEAVRRLRIPATILEVTRQPGSLVEVRRVDDPAKRALEDAGALCADESVPHKVAARVVPNFCRLAVEATLTAGARRRLLDGGAGHDEVESRLTDAKRLTEKAALAFFGDAARGGDVLKRLNQIGRELGDTFQALNKGAHEEHPGDLKTLVGASRKLVHELANEFT